MLITLSASFISFKLNEHPERWPLWPAFLSYFWPSVWPSSDCLSGACLTSCLTACVPSGFTACLAIFLNFFLPSYLFYPSALLHCTLWSLSELLFYFLTVWPSVCLTFRLTSHFLTSRLLPPASCVTSCMAFLLVSYLALVWQPVFPPVWLSVWDLSDLLSYFLWSNLSVFLPTSCHLSCLLSCLLFCLLSDRPTKFQTTLLKSCLPYCLTSWFHESYLTYCLFCSGLLSHRLTSFPAFCLTFCWLCLSNPLSSLLYDLLSVLLFDLLSGPCLYYFLTFILPSCQISYLPSCLLSCLTFLLYTAVRAWPLPRPCIQAWFSRPPSLPPPALVQWSSVQL